MEQRTPEEELEYRRYLRRRIRQRKRRRQVIIARCIVGAVAMLLVFLIFFGIGKLFFGGGEEEKKKPVPTATPFAVDVPEGYDGIYQKLYGRRKEFPQLDDILLSMERYPKDVLRMLVNNSETIDFVSDYLKHVDDKEANGGITAEELQQEGIPLFLQWDKRWGYVTYGNNIIAVGYIPPPFIPLQKKRDTLLLQLLCSNSPICFLIIHMLQIITDKVYRLRIIHQHPQYILGITFHTQQDIIQLGKFLPPAIKLLIYAIISFRHIYCKGGRCRDRLFLLFLSAAKKQLPYAEENQKNQKHGHSSHNAPGNYHLASSLSLTDSPAQIPAVFQFFFRCSLFHTTLQSCTSLCNTIPNNILHQ